MDAGNAGFQPGSISSGQDGRAPRNSNRCKSADGFSWWVRGLCRVLHAEGMIALDCPSGAKYMVETMYLPERVS